ncbi:MAG: hypothetical protein KC455_01660 [Carnobacterium sp.]|nr:hypothetical protein [Carnobacterium sp.]
MYFKVIVSFMFITIFLIRLIWPNLTIDTTSIILLVLALVPWFIQYIKSLEVTGIGKVELVSKEEKAKIQATVNEVGLSKETPIKEIKNKYSFYNLRYEDPKLALAGLRIELESVLKKLLEDNKIKIRMSGMRQITNTLINNEIITHKEHAIINDITAILNKAVHGDLDEYDSDSFDWVFEIGLNLLDSLSSKLNK